MESSKQLFSQRTNVGKQTTKDLRAFNKRVTQRKERLRKKVRKIGKQRFASAPQQRSAAALYNFSNVSFFFLFYML